MFDHTSTSTTKPNLPLTEATQNQLPFFAFWAIGLLNNLSYMIMLAGAKEISEGGTALVFLADILPTLLVKVSSPYWFYRVSYKTRILTASFCFVLALSSSPLHLRMWDSTVHGDSFSRSSKIICLAAEPHRDANGSLQSSCRTLSSCHSTWNVGFASTLQ